MVQGGQASHDVCVEVVVRKRYDITDAYDQLDEERAQWLRTVFQQDQYQIVNNGFLIDSYEVKFLDPRAETMYLLRWS